jgi:hypothetical protein
MITRVPPTVHKTDELDAAKNEIDSVRKFHLSQSKHLTSQYTRWRMKRLRTLSADPLENIGLKFLFLSQFSIQFVKLALAITFDGIR